MKVDDFLDKVKATADDCLANTDLELSEIRKFCSKALLVSDQTSNLDDEVVHRLLASFPTVGAHWKTNPFQPT